MKELLVIFWIGFLGFIAWEFIFAKQLPEKYSRLKPSTIRLIDAAIGALILLTIWHIVTRP